MNASTNTAFNLKSIDILESTDELFCLEGFTFIEELTHTAHVLTGMFCLLGRGMAYQDSTGYIAMKMKL